MVDTIALEEDYTDSHLDADISNLTNPANQLLDLDGPKINPNTLLTDVLRRDGFNYENIFEEGTLVFSARKGGRSLTSKEFDVIANSTVQNLVDCMHDASGIQTGSGDATNPIPGSANNIQGETGTLSTGGSVQNGSIRCVSNNGVDNALDFNLTAFQLTTSSGDITIPNLGFGVLQSAV